MTHAASRAFRGSGGSVAYALILTSVPRATLLESTVWTTDSLALTAGRMDAGALLIIILHVYLTCVKAHCTIVF